MEFRRTTDDNPEDNCEFYNQQKLRSFAKEHKTPVIAFEAFHENIQHSDGISMPDEQFM